MRRVLQPDHYVVTGLAIANSFRTSSSSYSYTLTLTLQ